MFQQKTEVTRNPLRTLILGVVLGGAVAIPSTGKAWYQRYHASICTTTWQGAVFQMAQEGGISGNTFHTQDGSALSLTCPVVATDREPYGPATLLNVAVRHTEPDPNSRVWTWACVKFAGATGGACGAGAHTIGTGVQTLQPDRSAWVAHPSHYAYVNVSLPNWGGANRPYFYGFSIAG
jgi:hypothetical protein